MTEILARLSLWGEHFSPRRAEEKSGIALSSKHEAGDIGIRGKYRGKPSPSGSAFLEPPEGIDPNTRIAWIIDVASNHLSAFQEARATICKFQLEVRYWDQCNLYFTTEELVRIAALGIGLAISCYDYTGREEAT
jgi:hypothetical protein